VLIRPDEPGDWAFTSHPRAFSPIICPQPEKFAIFLKNVNAWVLARGRDRDGHYWANAHCSLQEYALIV